VRPCGLTGEARKFANIDVGSIYRTSPNHLPITKDGVILRQGLLGVHKETKAQVNGLACATLDVKGTGLPVNGQPVLFVSFVTCEDTLMLKPCR